MKINNIILSVNEEGITKLAHSYECKKADPEGYAVVTSPDKTVPALYVYGKSIMKPTNEFFAKTIKRISASIWFFDGDEDKAYAKLYNFVEEQVTANFHTAEKLFVNILMGIKCKK